MSTTPDFRAFISALAAYRASEQAYEQAQLQGAGYFLLPNGTALAQVPTLNSPNANHFVDQDGQVIDADRIAELIKDGNAYVGYFDAVSGVEAVSAIIRRLLEGEATLEELAELSGRTTRRVHQIVTTLIPAGGWQVNKIKQVAAEGKKGRPRLNYSISPPQ